MNAAQNKSIPLTIKSPNGLQEPADIVLGLRNGPNYNKVTFPGPDQNYWMVILDRTSLKVVENFTFDSGSAIPTQMQNYLGNNDFMYILTTANVWSSNVPTGALYAWLVAEGADVGLRTVERAYAALNCSGYAMFGYTFVGVFGKGVPASLEYYNLLDHTLFSAIELLPISINGSTTYTPVAFT